MQCELEYNYRHFCGQCRSLASFPGPRAGERLPDLMFHDVEGQPVLLSSFLGRWVVLESGSMTCPMYAGNVAPLNVLAAAHPEVVFLVLYVREAHPGAHVGPHATEREKRLRAREVATVHGERRQVVVDDLNGAQHKILGAFPNMVYIINPEGVVAWRSDWMVAKHVQRVLEHPDDPLPPEHADPGLGGFLSFANWGRLWRSGADALIDFIRAMPAIGRQYFEANRTFRREGRLR